MNAGDFFGGQPVDQLFDSILHVYLRCGGPHRPHVLLWGVARARLQQLGHAGQPASTFAIKGMMFSDRPPIV